MATHSSILAWRIPRTEEPGGLQSMELQSQTQLKWPSTHVQSIFTHQMPSRHNTTIQGGFDYRTQILTQALTFQCFEEYPYSNKLDHNKNWNIKGLETKSFFYGEESGILIYIYIIYIYIYIYGCDKHLKTLIFLQMKMKLLFSASISCSLSNSCTAVRCCWGVRSWEWNLLEHERRGNDLLTSKQSQLRKCEKKQI